MGTGKTSAGKLAAKKLDLKYVDADEEIEKKAGITVSEIFSNFGEPYFRDLETKTIKEISKRDGQVISCGGGAVLRDENIKNLKASGIVVCLSASPEAIFERIKHETHRPLLQVPDPKKRIKELLAERAPHYAKADETIDTTNLTVALAAAKIIELVKARAG
jgi:shikimate kinase